MQSHSYSSARFLQNLTGEIIPYGRFGYNSLVNFLNSIPDVCQVNGYGTLAKVTAVANHKTEHINEMVQRNKTKGNYVRRSKFATAKTAIGHPAETAAELELWNPPKRAYDTKNDDFGPSESSQNNAVLSEEDYDDDGATGDDSVDYGAFNLPENFTSLQLDFPEEAIKHASNIEISDSDDDFLKPDFYQIKVTEVYTPYRFWLIRPDKGLDDLLAESLKFYDALDSQAWIMQEHHITIGTACVVRHDTCWLRGEVVADEEDHHGMYTIFLFDVGSVVSVSPSLIKYMLKRFGHLPRQVVNQY